MSEQSSANFIKQFQMLQIPRVKLQMLFDMIISTMDFGSGFLDTDEVNLLREVAVTLGVDPMKGTPYEHARNYPHPFDGGSWKNCKCRTCLQLESHSSHRS